MVNSWFFFVMFIIEMLEKDKISVSVSIIIVIVMESILDFMYMGWI